MDEAREVIRGYPRMQLGSPARRMPMEHADYPRMMYHADKEPVTVKSQAEEQALGAGWERHRFPVKQTLVADPGESLRSIVKRLSELEADVEFLKRAAHPKVKK